MIIDSHTHVYPDKVAGIVQEQMESRLGIPLFGKLTVEGLLKNMEGNGIDTSVIFCVAEKPSVVKPANDFLLDSCDGKRLIGLGTIHPDYEDYKDEIDRLRKAGIKGIKVHSYFQNCRPNEERMFRIYETLGEDMLVYFHSGALDKSYTTQDVVPSAPDTIAKVLEAFPKLKVVAAHFGGLYMLEEARKQLLGKNLYLDTVWTPDMDLLDKRVIADIIQEHGSDKVLFGTDFPFGEAKKPLEWIRDLPLNDEDKKRILGENARKLFLE
ncbi:amidohydrolase family protein [Chloroflexota bacterium]